MTDQREIFDILKKSPPFQKFFNNRDQVPKSQHDNVKVVHGACKKGVDAIADEFAKKFGFSCSKFPADWEQLGKKAGPVRNCEMADYGDVLVAIWDCHSRGTRDMINKMLAFGKETHVYTIWDENE
jgi:hypothetical protein